MKHGVAKTSKFLVQNLIVWIFCSSIEIWKQQFMHWTETMTEKLKKKQNEHFLIVLFINLKMKTP